MREIAFFHQNGSSKMKQDVMLPVRVVVHAGRRLRPSDCPFRPSAFHLLSDCYSFFSVSRSNRNRALRRVNYNRPPCGVKAIRTHRHLHTHRQTLCFYCFAHSVVRNARELICCASESRRFCIAFFRLWRDESSDQDYYLRTAR